ncbi:hypothetical protein [Clostridium faecium]|uniref:Uncharacterized protein n=1 Tax=Clostridium faecium TaxID=2762223 RepID=A0ABR8YNL4_9CLOT|nr:hypothetical protein [Clostridium faecium]MBD8045835.1 hypothetical protein [Clostridium faecium]
MSNEILNKYLETTLFEYNFITNCIKVLLISAIVICIFKLMNSKFE